MTWHPKKTYDKSFVDLIMRSPKVDGEWRNVSKTLSSFVAGKVEQSPELFETQTVAGQMQIKLSDTGSVVTAWKAI
jgi:hypothetical protein